MKTKEQKNNINVITLGCSKNTYDSEILMGQLKNNGAVVKHESDDESSDIVIIHTEWNDFKSINFKKFSKNKKLIIYDMRNIYSPNKIKKLGFKYFGIGR